MDALNGRSNLEVYINPSPMEESSLCGHGLLYSEHIYENVEVIQANVKIEEAFKIERDSLTYTEDLDRSRSSSTYSSTETDYPPLTDQHVLNAFKGSGITLGEVMHLGCLLDIPRAEMEVLKLEQRANPAMCAMLTIYEWKKRDPECVNLHYTYKRLHEVLQACKLNCIIPHLHSLDASKNIDWVKIMLKRQVVKHIKHFNRDQAEVFRESLGIDKEPVKGLVEESRASTGSQIALLTYEEWEKQTTYMNDKSIRKAIRSLLRASSIKQDILSLCSPKLIPSSPPSSDIDNDKFQCHYCQFDGPTEVPTNATSTQDKRNEHKKTTLSNNGQENDVLSNSRQAGGQSSRSSKKGNKWRICCEVCLVISIALFLAAFVTLMCLSFLPQFPNFPSQPIFPNDVIFYETPIDSYWLDSISLELLSHEICSGEVISVKCSDVQFTELKNRTRPPYKDSYDYLYFAKGTRLSFSLSDHTMCEYHTAYYVWLFTSLTAAEENSNEDFDTLACLDPPSDTWCIKITDCSSSFNFTITKSSYYFIRCSQNDDNCTLLADIVMDLVLYNFESTHNMKINSVQLQSGQESNDLELHESLLSRDKICILATVSVDETCKKVDGSRAKHIVVKDHHRRRGLYIFPCSLLILTFLVIIIIFMVCLKRRVACFNKAVLNRHTDINNTE